MTDMPNDQIDPYESRLSRRVGAFSDQAVLPIDAAAIAASVAVGARARSAPGRLFGWPGAGARLGLIGAGAILAAAAAIAIGGGASRLFPPAQTATAEPEGLRMCTPNDVDAVITAWDGAAGRRIATVELHQIGAAACGVKPTLQPWLAGGDGKRLIVGAVPASGRPIFMEPGDVLHTLVQAGNYCGPAPKAPVTVAFLDGEALFVATALTPTDLSGLPPCNGTAGPTNDIQMQGWQPGPATP